MKKTIKIKMFAAIIILFFITGIWYGRNSLQSPKQIPPLEKISIGSIYSSFTNYSVYIAMERDYFKKNGLDVELKSYPYGKRAISEVMQGVIDFAISAETPFIYSVLNGNQIYALAALVTAEKHIGLIARKDKGILSGKDLKNKNIGVTIGTGGEYFMEIVLLLNGILREQVNTVHLKPGQMFDALIKGHVEAVVAWNPYLLKIINELGNNCSVFSAPELYTPIFLISAKKDYVHQNPKIVERLISSLNSASEFIQNHPDKSRKIVAKHLKIDESLIYELSRNYSFKIFLDQSFLRNMEDLAEWSVRKNMNYFGDMPNYLNFIYTKALKSVKPENMTIIK